LKTDETAAGYRASAACIGVLPTFQLPLGETMKARAPMQ
jgi:hypothetical protein